MLIFRGYFHHVLRVDEEAEKKIRRKKAKKKRNRRRRRKRLWYLDGLRACLRACSSILPRDYLTQEYFGQTLLFWISLGVPDRILMAAPALKLLSLACATPLPRYQLLTSYNLTPVAITNMSYHALTLFMY